MPPQILKSRAFRKINNSIINNNSMHITVCKTRLRSASYVSRQRGIARICCCAPCCGMAVADRRPAGWPCSNRSTTPGRRAHISKPVPAACGGRMVQTDRRTADSCIDPAPRAGSANKKWSDALRLARKQTMLSSRSASREFQQTEKSLERLNHCHSSSQ